MRCPRCRHENPLQAKFCSECGASLAALCSGCGAALAADAKFCMQCGAPATGPAMRFGAPQSYTPKHLAERILTADIEGERKQVTVLFADLKGSMELLAERDPEEARKVLDPVLERMMEAVHHYEGTVNQVMGDGIMALFGAPLAHEDHAVRACFAALRMQEAIRRYSEEVRRSAGIELRIRVGLNSGEVVVRSIGSDLRMDYTAVGQTTHLAARMEQLANPGTVRLTAATLALAEGYVEVKPLGPIPVKGIVEPVEVYELTGASLVRTRLQAARARGFTRFVGRDEEMAQLRAAAEQARGGRGQAVAVVGEPGVGKSRLYYEFVQSHHTHGWLCIESSSVSYGKATPYLPLADLFRSYFHIEARDDMRAVRAKVTGNLLALDEALQDAVAPALWLLDALPADSAFLRLDPAARRRQTLAAAKRILLRESQVQPLLLVFEDLHWIDEETQAFLDALIDSLPGARLLLAVNYRPEYRHAWGTKSCYRQLRIDPLPAETAHDLLLGLLGNDAGVAPLKPLLIERTQGNPLFLEESVRSLVESGVLAGARGAYRLVGTLETVRVPATVQTILAARIDRLAAPDKRLLQAAAVVGTDVPFSLLQEIAGLQDAELRSGLARLQAAEFVYESRLFPELEYSFKHALTHDVAYGSVLQERKRALHAAIVDAIERLHADRLAEQTDLLAHHALRAELGSKAVRYLRQAGERASARSANREAVQFFEQGLALLARQPDTPEVASEALDLRIQLGPALIATKGAVAAEVEESYRAATSLAERLGDDARRFPAVWGVWFVHFTRGNYAEALPGAQRQLTMASQGGDAGQRVEAQHSMWATLCAMGRSAEAAAHFEQGLVLYDPELHSKHALIYAGHDPYACCHWHMASSRWVQGFADQALTSAERAVRYAEQLGHSMTHFLALWFSAYVHFERGDRVAAANLAEKSLAIANAHGLQRWGESSALMAVLQYGGDKASTADPAELGRLVAGAAGTAWRKVFNLCVLAGLYGQIGRPELGRQVLATLSGAHREAFYASEVLRLDAELLLHIDQSAWREAEAGLVRALEIATSRRELSLALRATNSLARLWMQHGRREEALRRLSSIYAQFTEGFETADQRAARELFSELGAKAPPRA
jgi:class 3 adenylate cyclase/tetratricopeptide (TPR) repeat protein